MSRSNEEVDVCVEILRESERAIQVTDGDVTEWIPKSQLVDYKGKPGQTTTITMPEWLAKDKNLI